jgi:hypothetical protein
VQFELCDFVVLLENTRSAVQINASATATRTLRDRLQSHGDNGYDVDEVTLRVANGRAKKRENGSDLIETEARRVGAVRGDAYLGYWRAVVCLLLFVCLCLCTFFC